VISWLNTVPLGITLKRLMDAVEVGTVQRAHVIRFEDLTTKPKIVMQKAYEYLGLPYFEHDFDRVEQVTKEDDSYYPIYGDHKIRSKVAPVPLDYLQTLGRDVCQGVMADNAEFYKTFYPDAR
jgi:sulfotransferase